jgi:hypothetical protein
MIHSSGRVRNDGKRKTYTYICSTHATGVPNYGASIDYHPFEAAVLHSLRELKPEDIFPRDVSFEDANRAEISRLSGRLMDIDNEL